MSRRNKSVKRPVPPDPRYDSQTVSKFVNNLMYEGKKSVAEGIFYTAMDMIEERTGQPGVSVFKQAVNNAKPRLRGHPPWVPSRFPRGVDCNHDGSESVPRVRVLLLSACGKRDTEV
ncbi:MAG: hypothetical protein ACJ8BF_09155, partial [Gemmatimonadales bacterium]